MPVTPCSPAVVPGCDGGVGDLESWLTRSGEVRARQVSGCRALTLVMVGLWRRISSLLLTLTAAGSFVIAGFLVSMALGFVVLGLCLLALDVLNHLGSGADE